MTEKSTLEKIQGLAKLKPGQPPTAEQQEMFAEWRQNGVDVGRLVGAASAAEAGLNAVIDVSVGKLKILEKTYELARKAGLTDKVDDIARQIANHKNGGINSPNTADGVPIREYPDGSFRTPDGKFASQGGLPSPGTKSAQEYTQYLRDNGFDVVGEELTVRGAVGNRRYDAVVRTDSGELWGIEYKSGGATKTPQQDFNDMYINQFGADGVGQLAGETVVGNITIYLP